MKILIINHYIGSSHYGMDYRQYYLAKEWVNQGHQVSILGADYSHLRIHQPDISKDLETEWIEGIRYLWLKAPKYRFSGFARILNILVFVLKSLRYSKRISWQLSPELILVASTYVLDIYPAYRIARRTRARLVYELHDLWPLSPMEIGGYSRRHPFVRLVQKAENFACRKCDYFISLLSNAKDYLISHGLTADKFIYIPNGFSDDNLVNGTIKIPEEHRKLFEKIKKQSRIIVGYAGGHAPSNALGSLIQAAKKIPANLDVAFVLVGDGSQKTELIKMAERLNQDTVHFLPAVSKAAIPDLLRRCDILYAGGVSSKLHTYGTSFNKVTDYMLAGKPIIFAVNDPNSLVEKVGCGKQVAAENPDAIADAITDYSNLLADEREGIGTKGREYALKKMRYSSIAKTILEAVNVR